jgi:hypothetical protein
MTLISYQNDPSPSTYLRRRRRRLTGTRHSGPEWTCAVGVLRSATHNALNHAGWRRSVTTDQVGTDIIDRIGELNGPALHVLAVVFGILVRASRRAS